jgi:hypothetical protein
MLEPGINMIFYNDPSEFDLFSKVNPTKFKSIEHLTSFLMYSGKIPLSQLVISLGTDFLNLGHVKRLINSNNIASNGIKTISRESYETAGGLDNLKQIFDPKFWRELIRLYITHVHPYVAFFNLQTFNPSKIPKPILIALYYKGYTYYPHKTPELTDYMNNLAKVQLKTIIFTPNFQNFHALTIYCSSYHSAEHTKLTRAYLAQLTRMAHCLGVHVNTERFEENFNYERQLIYRKIIMMNKYMSGPSNIYPNYIVDAPPNSKDLYPSELDTLTFDDSLLSFGFSQVDLSLIAKLSELNNKFKDYSITLVWFNLTANFIKKGELEAYCTTKLSKLKQIYDKTLLNYDKLAVSYSSQIKLVLQSRELITLSYIKETLDILEYWKFLSGSKVSQELVSQTIGNCQNLLQLSSKLKNFKVKFYYLYLIGFTLIRLYKVVGLGERKEILAVLDAVRELVGSGGGGRGGTGREGNNELGKFNGLIFNTGLKLIQAK